MDTQIGPISFLCLKFGFKNNNKKKFSHIYFFTYGIKNSSSSNTNFYLAEKGGKHYWLKRVGVAVGTYRLPCCLWGVGGGGNFVFHVVMVSTLTYLVSIADRPEGSECTR
jgi:hypothetical protein